METLSNKSMCQSLQISGLLNENHSLKVRLSKLSEIESYIDVLVQNNKNYQDQISILQAENRKLRHLMEEAVAQRLHEESSHQQVTALLKKNHLNEISELVAELKSILRDREDMQINHKNIIEELQSQFMTDLQKRRIQLERVDKQYQLKINKLNAILRDQQKQIDHLSRQLKQTKINHLNQAEHLSSHNRQLLQKCDILDSQLTKTLKQLQLVAKQYKQVTLQNQRLSTKCLTVEQEKNDVILEIKRENKKLINELDKQTVTLRNMESLFKQNSSKLNQLLSEQQQLRRQRNQLENQGRRSLRIIEQTQYVLKGTQEKLRVSQQQATSENSHHRGVIGELQGINQELKHKLDETTREKDDKTRQIRDLLMTTEKLQSRLLTTQKEALRLVQANAQLADKINWCERQASDNELELRSLRQKLSLYHSHNATLEEMVEKERRRAISFQADRKDTGKMMEYEMEISKKYEIEIKKLADQFYHQKTLLFEQHNQQRQKLRAFYEYTLTNKEDLFSRKLQLLENEIDALRGYA